MNSLSYSFLVLLFTKVLKYETLDEAIKEELLQVSIIFRHGERAPDITFPTYKYVDSNWKNGPGNLTERGRNQVKRLAEGLAKRYLAPQNPSINWACGGNFSVVHNVNTMVYASKSPRSKESASIFIKSFVNPPGNGAQLGATFEDKFIRLPDPEKPDLLLSGAIRCKALVSYVIKEEFGRDPVLLNYAKTNMDFFTLLGEKTGYGKAAVIYILPVADTLACDKVAGYPLPEWIDEPTYDRIQQLAHFIFSHLGRSNDIILKGSVGLITKKMLDGMDETVKMDYKGPSFCQLPLNAPTTPSITLYSAHDHTIVPLLNMLNIPFTSRPGYAAALTLELWSHQSNTPAGPSPKKYRIKIAYKNYEGAVFRYDPIVWQLSELRANLSRRLPASKEDLEAYCEKGEDALPFKTDVFH